MQSQNYAKYILAIQLFGALMFTVVCLAYILGLPSDEVFHEELAYRVVIGGFGSIFFAGSVILLAVAYVTRNRLLEA